MGGIQFLAESRCINQKRWRSNLYLFFGCWCLELLDLVSVSAGVWSGRLKDLVYMAMVFGSFAVVMGVTCIVRLVDSELRLRLDV